MELSQNQIIIFGEDLAKAGVRDSFDFFARSPDPRMTVYIFVAKGKAGDVLNTEPGFEKFPATEIYMLIQDPIGSIDKTAVFAYELEQGLISKTTSLVAPIIEVKEEDGKKRIHISGCAVFKGDKVAGELNTRDSRGLQWVKGKVKYSALDVEFDGVLAEIIIMSSKGKITPVIKDDGSVMIKLEITGEGFMSSQTGTVNMSEPGNAKLLIKETERTIMQEVENTIIRAQELGTDIFGFGESVYRKYPREWKSLEPQWDEIFKNIRVEIDVTAKVKGSGRIAKPLYPEME